MELIMEKIPESLKKRMTGEEAMLRTEKCHYMAEREATELWRLRQLQLSPMVKG